MCWNSHWELLSGYPLEMLLHEDGIAKHKRRTDNCAGHRTKVNSGLDFHQWHYSVVCRIVIMSKNNMKEMCDASHWHAQASADHATAWFTHTMFYHPPTNWWAHAWTTLHFAFSSVKYAKPVKFTEQIYVLSHSVVTVVQGDGGPKQSIFLWLAGTSLEPNIRVKMLTLSLLFMKSVHLYCIQFTPPSLERWTCIK